MLSRSKIVLVLGVASCSLAAVAWAEEALPLIPPIQRVLPPEGVKLPVDVEAKLRERVTAIDKRLKPLAEQGETQRHALDVEIFTKAVRFALDLHEFYDAKKDVDKANKLLDEAERRLAELEMGDHSWTTAGRLVVRGYRSPIDNSVQPYGVVFPKDFDPKSKKKYPLYIWLHGRGDKATDLHFIHERMTQVGQLGEVDAIVVHPFGRQCVGFKSAGEIDVMHARNLVWMENREFLNYTTSLIGFSMGGAGAWHIGGHYAEQFRVVCPGAGFAETAKYTKTDPAKVPWYERKLWGVYDVPCYTRNLFNTEVIAYSGEKDKQIQAARVMEEAFKAEGRELTHLIGPGVEHKYEPKTLMELKTRIGLATLTAPSSPRQVSIETQTLRYNRMHRFSIEGLERHWRDSRLDAKREVDGNNPIWQVKTKNLSAFALLSQPPEQACIIDGQRIPLGLDDDRGRVLVRFEKSNGNWQRVERWQSGLRKRPRQQGPIDDAFMEPFIVVKPTGRSRNPLVQRWVEFELQHFIDRWKGLMRGEVQVKNDTEITEEDIRSANLVCFGDPDSNAVIRRAYKQLPVGWQEGKVAAGKQSWNADSHLPALIYPNPLLEYAEPTAEDDDAELAFIRGTNRRYLVINSGLTFREAHDRTNSQQNSKLPDWAVIDLSQLPDDKSPGRIAAAGFFDEEWKYQEPQE